MSHDGAGFLAHAASTRRLTTIGLMIDSLTKPPPPRKRRSSQRCGFEALELHLAAPTPLYLRRASFHSEDRDAVQAIVERLNLCV
jgi:hypothetical protein